MLKAYQFRFYPNKEQKIYFANCFGSTRFVYNQMLADRKEIYETHKDDKELLKFKAKHKSKASYNTNTKAEISALKTEKSNCLLIKNFQNIYKENGHIPCRLALYSRVIGGIPLVKGHSQITATGNKERSFEMKEEKRAIHLMGTVIKLRIQHSNPEKILVNAENLLRDYEKRFSANDKNSDLMKINDQAGEMPVQVDNELFELIKIGKRHSLPSDSALNITIGPLVQLWRIGFEDAKRPPEQEVKEKLKMIQPENIILNEEKHTGILGTTRYGD